MSLAPGTRLGVYQVLGPLGAGGMGEVYRGRDSRLGRDVALKVLPEVFASDPERLARFEREAQALAALKHPHIATIYGFEEKDGVRALVLELVEGDTLADRIDRGPLAIDEALAIARQIADAVEAAHEQGIVHRDLKPANIKVTPEGTVKVLDFGLAKLTGPAEGGRGSSPGAVLASGSATLQQDLSPTITSPAMLTGATVLMGTAAYMAPEQARGRPVDRRADIWAFGVVVYEMLTGRRAFEGETVTDVAGAVIHKEIDWAALPAATPSVLRMVLRRCLQKDPKQRFRDMGDVRLALEGAFAVEPAAPPGADRSRRSLLLPIAATALLAAGAGAAALWALTRVEPAPTHALRFDVSPNAEGTLAPFIEISPDGTSITYSVLEGGTSRLWVRSLVTGESRVIAPDHVLAPTFWSPDSRQLAFYSETDKRIKRVALAGGPLETVAETERFAGGTWNGEDAILFSDVDRIVRVPASGGKPVPVTTLDRTRGDDGHLGPRFLPDGRRFLFFRASGNPERAGVYVGSLDLEPDQQSGERLLDTQQIPVFAPGPPGEGRLLFARGGVLMSQPFDPDALALSGTATAVIDEPVYTFSFLQSASVSSNGTLIYLRGFDTAGTPSLVDRKGVSTPLVAGAAPSSPRYPRLSPDGRRLALVVGGQLWVYEMDGRPPVRLTSGERRVYSSVWTPDGQYLLYERDAGDGPYTLFRVRTDGSGSAPEPAGPEGHFHPHGWSADRREIIATRLVDNTTDLVRFAPDRGSPLHEVLATPQQEGTSAAVSPDGRWVAYASDATGRSEIWVRPLEPPGPAVRVSPGGGAEPAWSRDGRELYYLNFTRILSVKVGPGPGFSFEPPTELFTLSTATIAGDSPPSYDVAADGRFVMIASGDSTDIPISVILNWSNLLKDGSAPH